MSNYGDTTIIAAGPQADLAQLAAEILASATGHLELSPTRLAPDIYRHDGLLIDAQLQNRPDGVGIRLTAVHDTCYLDLATALSVQHPALRFESIFEGEGSSPSFTLQTDDVGQCIFRTEFAVAHVALVRPPDATPQHGHTLLAVPLFQRTPEIQAAYGHRFAPPHPFLARTITDGWGCDASDPTCPTFQRADISNGSTVIALSGLERTATIFTGVDERGGYATMTAIGFDDAGRRFPDLAAQMAECAVTADAEFATWQQTLRETATREADF